MAVDIPSNLRRIADEIESGKLKESSCIVVLTSEESDEFASYFFGEDMTYAGAIDTVNSLVIQMEEDLDDAAKDVTIN